MRRPSAPALVLLVVALLLAAGSVDSRSAGAAEADVIATTTTRHGATEKEGADEEAFYHKVGNFAVLIYSLWHKITPVPALERVVSAATRPARGEGAVDYLLVLRVAGLGTCEAVVWGVRGEGSEDWKLKYFKPQAN